jgi:hypothetical protein
MVAGANSCNGILLKGLFKIGSELDGLISEKRDEVNCYMITYSSPSSVLAAGWHSRRQH